jgi:hypothetical protein
MYHALCKRIAQFYPTGRRRRKQLSAWQHGLGHKTRNRRGAMFIARSRQGMGGKRQQARHRAGGDALRGAGQGWHPPIARIASRIARCAGAGSWDSWARVHHVVRYWDLLLKLARGLAELCSSRSQWRVSLRVCRVPKSPGSPGHCALAPSFVLHELARHSPVAGLTVPSRSIGTWPAYCDPPLLLPTHSIKAPPLRVGKGGESQ